jgi:spermidine synthase
VKHITICDIEPLVPHNVAARLFANENYGVVDDPRTHVVIDDGRHFIRTTREKFDVITSDPIDPWVKGCASLNTVEYYQMCKEHLNPGGVVSLWIPLYESKLESAKSLIATFFQVFPNGILFSNDQKGEGYDAVLLGQVEPTSINVDRIQRLLDSRDMSA